MAQFEERYETAKWRTFWLIIGFVILVAIGAATVLLPELEDEASQEPAGTRENAGAEETPQE